MLNKQASGGATAIIIKKGQRRLFSFRVAGRHNEPFVLRLETKGIQHLSGLVSFPLSILVSSRRALQVSWVLPVLIIDNYRYSLQCRASVFGWWSVGCGGFDKYECQNEKYFN